MELLDKEHYINIITLLQKSLEFYADKENYVQNKSVNRELVSRIELDEGEQARFTLNSVVSILKQTQEMGENIDEILKNMGNSESEGTITKLLDDMKKFKDGY